jgi:hypothetical protein
MAKIKRNTPNSRARGPITARPRTMAAEVSSIPIVESGLSVDADDLGAHFLSEATQQGNFESLRAEQPELSIVDGAPSDEPLLGPNFDPDHDVWEQTVDLTLQGDPDEEPPIGES